MATNDLGTNVGQSVERSLVANCHAAEKPKRLGDTPDLPVDFEGNSQDGQLASTASDARLKRTAKKKLARKSGNADPLEPPEGQGTKRKLDHGPVAAESVQDAPDEISGDGADGCLFDQRAGSGVERRV